MEMSRFFVREEEVRLPDLVVFCQREPADATILVVVY